MQDQPPRDERPIQFSLRAVFVVTALMALVTAATSWAFRHHRVSYLVLAFDLGFVVGLLQLALGYFLQQRMGESGRNWAPLRLREGVLLALAMGGFFALCGALFLAAASVEIPF